MTSYVSIPSALTFAQQCLQIATQAGNQPNMLASTYKGLYNFIWNNAQNNTPASVVTQWGTGAASVFSLLAKWLTYLNSVDSTLISTDMQAPPTGYTFTSNSDGTVTISTVSAPTS